jgi:hypothetical protein
MVKVDKAWQSKGLDMYSTESILASLNHYGIKFGEDEIKAQMENLFPVHLAMIWSEEWRGTGQFLNFHVAAAEELWRRLMPGQLAPMEYGIPFMNLIKELDEAAEGVTDSRTLETRFKVCEGLLQKVPQDTKRRTDFFFEMQMTLGEEWTDLMNALVEKLAATKHAELCQRYLTLETGMFPSRKGVSEALAILALDETNEAALASLESIANDTARSPESRVDASSILVDFEQFVRAKAPLLALMDLALKEKDSDLARGVLEELRLLMPNHLSREDLEKLKNTLNQLLDTEDDSLMH